MAVGNTAGSRGTGECEGCLDVGSVATVTGTVDRTTAGIGVQFPSLILATTDGKLLTLRVGPVRALLAADFEIAARQKLTVTYAVSTCKEELVALTLIDSAGRTIVLRNPDGCRMEMNFQTPHTSLAAAPGFSRSRECSAPGSGELSDPEALAHLFL